MSQSKSRKYWGHTIRARGATWQVDFGTRDGMRVQPSFRTKQDATNAIDDEMEDRRIEEIGTRHKWAAIFGQTDKRRMGTMGAQDKLPGAATLTEATVIEIRSRLGRFVANFGDSSFHEIAMSPCLLFLAGT